MTLTSELLSMASATRHIMSESGLAWVETPVWTLVPGLGQALHGRMRSIATGRVVEIGPFSDLDIFWRHAYRAAVDTDWSAAGLPSRELIRA